MLETPAIPGANGENPPVQPPVTTPQVDVDKIAAAARREAEGKLKEVTDRLAAFEAKEKERADAELTETERLKKELAEKDTKLGDYESKVKTYEEQEEARKQELLAKVDKELEGLSEEQKALVEKMPLDGKLILIAQLKTVTPAPVGGVHSGALPPSGYAAEIKACKTHKEIESVNQKYYNSR